MVRKILLWAAVLSVMAAIFFFSSQNAAVSGKTSTGFTEKIIRAIGMDKRLSDAEIAAAAEKLDYVVRKSAHFTIYAALGFFVFLLLSSYRHASAKTLLYSIIWAFLYSCSDEIHQHFVPGRAMLARDVLIDTCGSFFGALAAALCCFAAAAVFRRSSAAESDHIER